MLGNSTKVYLLGPVHTHEAVHLAQVDHLILCSIPQVIMCLSLLKLLPGHYQWAPQHIRSLQAWF